MNNKQTGRKEGTHTPGPWTVCGPRIEAHDRDGLPFAIAEVWSGTRTTPREDADARLIAAAPELLEAANLALRAIDPTGESKKDDVGGPLFLSAKALRAAIAKAEGREGK